MRTRAGAAHACAGGARSPPRRAASSATAEATKCYALSLVRGRGVDLTRPSPRVFHRAVARRALVLPRGRELHLRRDSLLAAGVAALTLAVCHPIVRGSFICDDFQLFVRLVDQSLPRAFFTPFNRHVMPVTVAPRAGHERRRRRTERGPRAGGGGCLRRQSLVHRLFDRHGSIDGVSAERR